jgi:hypothetical protein
MLINSEQQRLQETRDRVPTVGERTDWAAFPMTTRFSVLSWHYGMALFTENETNNARLFAAPNASPYD